MKWITIFGLFAFGMSAAQQDGRSIVEKAKEKIATLKSIELNISFNDKYTGQISADVIISREKPYPVFGVAKVKMTGIVTSNGSSKEISMAYDGNTFSYADPAKNELVLIENPTYSKIGRSGQLTYGMAIPPVYYEQAVLDSLLNAVKYDIRADTTIFDQPAFMVIVTRNAHNKISGETYQVETTWYFHKDSYLPLGTSNKGSHSFYKIRSINSNYAATDFSLTGVATVKQVAQPAAEVSYLGLNTIAPDWTLPSNKQSSITLSKLKGKVVMLDFWGTWCAPCLKSMPAVQSIYDHFKDQPVEVIGVSVELENAVDVPAFVKRQGYTYPIALNGKTIAPGYRVTQYPTIYILDKQGKIIFAGPGEDLEKKKEDIIQVIQKALSADERKIRQTDGLEPLTDGLLPIGTPAPLWQLTSNKAKTIDFAALKGKVVLLDFWGTWCVPCIQAMPDIQEIYDHFKGAPVEVIGISVELQKSADPAAFVKNKGYSYTIALNGNRVAEQYKVATFPTLYIIGKDGKIIHAEHSGGRENLKEDLIARINKALSQEKLPFTIEGHLKDFKKKKAVIHVGWMEPREFHEFLKADIIDGKFKVTGQISQPALASLRIVTYNDSLKAEQQFPWECDAIEFFLGGGKTTVIGKDSLSTAKIITASDEYSSYQRYADALHPVSKEIDSIWSGWKKVDKKDSVRAKVFEYAYWLAVEKKHRFYQSFILENPNSHVSITALNAYVIQVNDKQRLNIALGLLKSLSAPLQRSPIALAVRERIDDKLYPVVGKPMTSLMLESVDGSKVDITKYKGKVLLIDFWASWCSPCIKEFPELIALYQKYKDQGVEFIGISIDTNKPSWLKAIKDFKLPWPQFVDGTQGGNSYAGKAGKMYRVQGIPAKFLVDQEGVIVAKDLTIEKLETRIKELLARQKSK